MFNHSKTRNMEVLHIGKQGNLQRPVGVVVFGTVGDIMGRMTKRTNGLIHSGFGVFIGKNGAVKLVNVTLF